MLGRAPTHEALTVPVIHQMFKKNTDNILVYLQNPNFMHFSFALVAFNMFKERKQ